MFPVGKVTQIPPFLHGQLAGCSKFANKIAKIRTHYQIKLTLKYLK
jgi:hypothetical protein